MPRQSKEYFAEYYQKNRKRKAEQSKARYRRKRDEILEGHKARYATSEGKLRKLWQGMLDRCENPNHKSYARYGGRGITVCKRWKSFEEFYTWALANGFRMHLQIDRKDNDKGYCPSNCRWTTVAENSRNRVSNILNWRLVREIRASYSGKRGDAARLSREYGISPGYMCRILKNQVWKE